MTPTLPTWSHEKALIAQGFCLIAGVDEAGMGCLAGPVYAAAVIFKPGETVEEVRDSKTLSELQRDRLIGMIKEKAIAWAVGRASWEEVDELNVRQAGVLASRRAVEALSTTPDFVISDAFHIAGLTMKQKAVVKADIHVKSVASASIIAKVERDKEMKMHDAKYPGYGFAQHKGYGTKMHQEALVRLGACEIHRKTYAPVRAVLEKKIKVT